jgi:N-acetylglucosamine-6-phosphate deacetylase
VPSRASGSILTPSGWVAGAVEMSDGRISDVVGRALAKGERPLEPYILPGFIDLHVHGGGGYDWRGGEEAVRGLARFHASRGTVAMAPTTATASVPAIETALAAIDAVMENRRPTEAIVLGSHLEGPFLNPKKLGAQEAATLPGDPLLARDWAERFSIRIATVAPEIAGGLDVVRVLRDCGVRVQIAHSLATAEETAEGFRCGCSGFTHLFNAMSGVDHRSPGVAAYALAHGQYAEVICDLLHVDLTVLLAAYRAIPYLYSVSDSTLAGLADGRHQWGGHAIDKSGIRVTLEDGKTLAGSAITQLDALRNLVEVGLTLERASDMLSARPAKYLGLTDLGAIGPQARACMVVLDEDLRLIETWIDGKPIPARSHGLPGYESATR